MPEVRRRPGDALRPLRRLPWLQHLPQRAALRLHPGLDLAGRRRRRSGNVRGAFRTSHRARSAASRWRCAAAASASSSAAPATPSARTSARPDRRRRRRRTPACNARSANRGRSRRRSRAAARSSTPAAATPTASSRCGIRRSPTLPKCAYALLTLKTTKRRGTELVCPNEECDYTAPYEAPESPGTLE